jgi:translation initiation factor IF-2
MKKLSPQVVDHFLRPKAKKRAKPVPKEKKKVVTISEGITVGELAEKLGIPPAVLIKKMFDLGEMATINQSLDAETAEMLAHEYGYEVKVISLYGEDMLPEEEEKEEEKVLRAPIVTVMGHVDHGKTSLLDAIRETEVAKREAGNITQHIGAYQVSTPHGKIVFLDTPGHEAFTSIRARGAQVTDIVVLVVAADEGVMPQTVEAIDHAKAANVPIIVAINKIDRPQINIPRVKQQLSELGCTPEEWGGKTIFVEISAKQKIGLEKLLEMISLEAEMLELKANPHRLAKGVVIESRLDKRLGAVATVLVQEGTLKHGDPFLIGNYGGKIRKLLDDTEKPIQSAGPSTPVEIVGLEGIPVAGDPFQVVKDEKLMKQIAAKRQEIHRLKNIRQIKKLSLADLHEKIELGEVKELKLIIKADVFGSLEALIKSLTELSVSEKKIKVNIIHRGTGGINDSDVLLAAASNAIIVGFNVRPTPSAREKAEAEGVDVRLYRVIYEVISDIKSALKGLLEPEYKEVFKGLAYVKELFRISEVGTVAGCLVQKGTIPREARVRVLRENVVVYEGRITSLRRFKNDVKEVGTGLECGIKIENFNDLKVEDTIEAYVLEKVER